MGRHYTSEQKTEFSAGFIITVVIVVVAVIAAIAWFVLGMGDDDSTDSADGGDGEAAQCIEGDLELPVAATDRQMASAVIESWNATDPVVRDYCVTAQYTDELSSAAVYLAPDTARTERTIEQSERSRASEQRPAPLVSGQAAGLLHSDQEDVNAEDIAADEVSYPGDTEAAGVVAAALSDDDDQAADLLVRDRELTLSEASGLIAATQAEAAEEDGEFTALDGALVEYSAIALNQGENTSEEQYRAADAFVDELASQYDEGDQQAEVERRDAESVSATGVWEKFVERTEEGSEADSADSKDADQAQLSSTDTLFLIDSSGAMDQAMGDKSRMDATAESVSGLAPKISDSGHRVSLWNYSSPLNPGVEKGWRRNISFGPGEEVAQSVQLLGTGGVPQTSEALLAAAGTARDYANGEESTSTPARIVLVTTGMTDNYDGFVEQFRDAAGSDSEVELAVVFLGDNPDQALEEIATSLTTVTNQQQLDEALRQAAGV